MNRFKAAVKSGANSGANSGNAESPSKSHGSVTITWTSPERSKIAAAWVPEKLKFNRQRKKSFLHVLPYKSSKSHPFSAMRLVNFKKTFLINRHLRRYILKEPLGGNLPAESDRPSAFQHGGSYRSKLRSSPGIVIENRDLVRAGAAFDVTRYKVLHFLNRYSHVLIPRCAISQTSGD